MVGQETSGIGTDALRRLSSRRDARRVITSIRTLAEEQD